MKIDDFHGKYFFLSNFYPSAIVDDDGINYPTVEHYFQANKTTNLQDKLKIAQAQTPGEAKKLGRSVYLRKDWENIKDSVMLNGLRLKFAIPQLRERLLETGNAELIEGTTWHDNYWGNCCCDKCRNIRGRNQLGILLQQLREEIKNKNA